MNRFVVIKLKLMILFLLGLGVISCSYEQSDLNLESVFKPTWSFSEGSQYIFENNFVEINSGQARLRTLDINNLSNNFAGGTQTGVIADSGRLKLLQSASAEHASSWTPRWSDIIQYNKMNGHLNAEIGSPLVQNNLNLTGFVPTRGILEQAYHLDGVDDAFEFTKVQTSQFTVSVWVKLNSYTNTYPRIFDFGSLQLWFQGSLITFRASHSGNRGDWISSGTNVEVGKWYHVAITYDSALNTNDPIIYLNGNSVPLVELQSPTGVLQNNSGTQYIGNRQALDRPWHGYIDEFTLWSETLSAQDINLIYQTQSQVFSESIELSSHWTPKYNQLVAYWSFDGDARDQVGSHHGALGGDSSFSEEAQLSVMSASFDGTNDYISISPSPDFELSDNFTIAGWFNITDISSESSIFANWNSVSNEGFQLFVDNTGQKLKFRTGDGTSFTTNHTLPAVRESAWHHFVVTRKAGQNTLILDGKIIDKWADTIVTPVGVTPIIGVRNNSSLFSQELTGFIDELAFWGASLSDQEALVLYHHQKQKYAATYESETLQIGSATALWPDLRWKTPLPFFKQLTGDITNDGLADSELASSYQDIAVDLMSGLVGYWTLNETSAGSAPGGLDLVDSSGQGHHGTATSVTYNINGVLDKGLSFDGVSSSVLISSSGDLNLNMDSDYAAALWVRIPFEQLDLDVTHNWILEKWNFTPNYYPFALRIHNSTSTHAGKIQFAKYDGVLAPHIFTTQTYNDNRWHFIVLQKKGSNLELYIDGELAGVVADTTASSPLSTGDIRVGDNNNMFHGDVDELSVWNKSFSASEVLQLYRRGANRVKFQVKSCIDPACQCESYSSLPLGSTTDCDGDGVLNEFDSEDIHSSHYVGPGGDGTTYYSELYNKDSSQVVFDCSLNISDTNPLVCANNEISLLGASHTTAPSFVSSVYSQFVKPVRNSYIKYKIFFEAESNHLCGSTPCFPEVERVNLQEENEVYYFGGVQEIRPRFAISYNKINSIHIEANDDCASFRVSQDGTDYYYNGSSWIIASTDEHVSTAEQLTAEIQSFVAAYGAGAFKVVSYLNASGLPSESCYLNLIDVNYD